MIGNYKYVQTLKKETTMKFARFLLAFALSCVVPAGASAALLFERAPASVAYGIQSDASTGPLQQSLALGPSMVERIIWWGFHGANSLGPDQDAFEVYLDGQLMGGSLVSSDIDGLTRHVLELSAAVASPTKLTLWNNSFDVEWFWQSGAVGDDVNAAFALEGEVLAAVPEPATVAVLGIGILAAAAARRTRRRAPRVS